MIPHRLTMEKLNITQWAEEDRPREKLMRLGAEALTNAELLAILIGSGSPEETAVELMKRVLGDCNNNLNTLGKKSISELTDARYEGLGPAKAITILAACELGKRRQSEKAEERQRMDSAEAIYEYMRPKMQDLCNGAGVGAPAQPELQTHKDRQDFERRDKRDLCRCADSVEGGTALQCHRSGSLATTTRATIRGPAATTTA